MCKWLMACPCRTVARLEQGTVLMVLALSLGCWEPLPLLHLPLSRNNQAGRKWWAWALQSHPRGRKGLSGTGACSPLKPGRKGFTFPPGLRHILFLWHPVPLSWLGARAHSFSWWPQATFSLQEGHRRCPGQEYGVHCHTCWGLKLASPLILWAGLSVSLSLSLLGFEWGPPSATVVHAPGPQDPEK